MFGDQCFQLAYELGVPPERKVGVDSPLDRGEPQLLDSPDRRLRERLVCEVGERRSAPERERLSELVPSA